MRHPEYDELRRKILILDEMLWERRASEGRLDAWLSNFKGRAGDAAEEQLHALYLASRFLYFGDREIRGLLVALYRDLFRYPVVAGIRKSLGNTRGSERLETEFHRVLRTTRFLALGNPSESGAHLLYFFRQENELAKELFVNAYEVVDVKTGGLTDKQVVRYVFIDDFCGSGTQVTRYSKKIVPAIKAAAQLSGVAVSIGYYALIATTDGLRKARSKSAFDEVRAVVELNESYRCFSDASRYFDRPPSGIDLQFAQKMCLTYGRGLYGAHPFGFGGGQLMVAFHHNTPNNTIPIFWHESQTEPLWRALFRRFRKLSYVDPP